MNENIKTFSLVVITICVFIMTVIDILNMIEERMEKQADYSSFPNRKLSSKQDPAANAPKTSIKFDEKNFDFGDVTEGEVVHHSFTFTNTGSNPLIITSAKGSCGCTVSTYPKEPIAPGAKANIEVQFNSAGKKDIQNKDVTVSANTDPPETGLTIHANVREKQ
ncbi:MAG TPA: DUF1573 domain-containing protein [Chitinophagales bacterium]|nr:DUF1573 domain-containing protein [Chitinophagales bacterium]